MYGDTFSNDPSYGKTIRSPDPINMDPLSDMDSNVHISDLGCTWRKIEGSKGQYEVSDTGLVRNAWTGRILKQYTFKKVSVVHLRGHLNRNFTVASLVARSFIGEGRVSHIDGDPQNNNLSNLEVL